MKIIKTLPQNDQTCGWITNLEPRESFPKINGKQTANWTIIGAGYTGLSAARRLSALKPNDKIIVIDAGAIGEGASARNSGFAMQNSSSGEVFDPTKLDEYLRINRINNAGINILQKIIFDHKIECQWRQVGKYNCGATEATEKASEYMVDWLKNAGTEYQYLSATELSKRLGTSYYQHGIWTKGDVLLQPAALIRGLSKTLPDNVKLYDYSAAIKITEQANKIQIDCPEGSITSDKLILATNSFLHTMSPKPTHTVPLTLTGSLTRPLNQVEQASIGNPKEWGILSLHPMGATIRYTSDHRILIRNTADYIANRTFNNQEMQAAHQQHLACLKQRFPSLENLSFENTWQGTLCISRNSSSLFGKLANRIYAAGCYNAAGISRGTAFGHALADYICGEGNSLVEDIMQYPKPQWMPPRPLLDLAMGAVVLGRKFGLGADG